MAEALCSVVKQPAMIAPNAPIDRIDIAFIICFLVHRKLVFIELSAIRSKSQPRASRLGRKVLHELNSNRKVTGKQGSLRSPWGMPLPLHGKAASVRRRIGSP